MYVEGKYMMYKNSVKLLFSNFSLVWKTLLYNLIVFVLVGGLSYLAALPVFELLIEHGLGSMIQNMFADFASSLNLILFVQDCGAILTSFSEIILDNFSSIAFNIILFLFIIFVFGKFVSGVLKATQSEVLYSSMSSNMRVGLITSFVGNSKRILLLQLTQFIVTFPIDIVITFAVLMCFRLFTIGGILSVLTPFIIMLVAMILVSLRISLFCAWMPLVAVKDMGIFASLKENFKLVVRRLPKIFANSLGVVFTTIVVNGFALLFTIGVGLFITIPLCSVLLRTYQMSAFYGCYGMRYYVDYGTIVEPKRMEATERLSRTKYRI